MVRFVMAGAIVPMRWNFKHQSLCHGHGDFETPATHIQRSGSTFGQ
jgi:hypothetical protein